MIVHIQYIVPHDNKVASFTKCNHVIYIYYFLNYFVI